MGRAFFSKFHSLPLRVSSRSSSSLAIIASSLVYSLQRDLRYLKSVCVLFMEIPFLLPYSLLASHSLVLLTFISMVSVSSSLIQFSVSHSLPSREEQERLRQLLIVKSVLECLRCGIPIIPEIENRESNKALKRKHKTTKTSDHRNSSSLGKQEVIISQERTNSD